MSTPTDAEIIAATREVYESGGDLSAATTLERKLRLLSEEQRYDLQQIAVELLDAIAVIDPPPPPKFSELRQQAEISVTASDDGKITAV